MNWRRSRICMHVFSFGWLLKHWTVVIALAEANKCVGLILLLQHEICFWTWKPWQCVTTALCSSFYVTVPFLMGSSLPDLICPRIASTAVSLEFSVWFLQVQHVLHHPVLWSHTLSCPCGHVGSSQCPLWPFALMKQRSLSWVGKLTICPGWT